MALTKWSPFRRILEIIVQQTGPVDVTLLSVLTNMSNAATESYNFSYVYISTSARGDLYWMHTGNRFRTGSINQSFSKTHSEPGVSITIDTDISYTDGLDIDYTGAANKPFTVQENTSRPLTQNISISVVGSVTLNKLLTLNDTYLDTRFDSIEDTPENGYLPDNTLGSVHTIIKKITKLNYTDDTVNPPELRLFIEEEDKTISNFVFDGSSTQVGQISGNLTTYELVITQAGETTENQVVTPLSGTQGYPPYPFIFPDVEHGSYRVPVGDPLPPGAESGSSPITISADKEVFKD